MGTALKTVKQLIQRNCSVFWEGAGLTQGRVAWFMDMRAQLRAVPSIQFTNTICTQLAADLVRQRLITTSTTGAAQQRVERKEARKKSTREIFKGGEQAVGELPSATDNPSAQNKCGYEKKTSRYLLDIQYMRTYKTITKDYVEVAKDIIMSWNSLFAHKQWGKVTFKAPNCWCDCLYGCIFILIKTESWLKFNKRMAPYGLCLYLLVYRWRSHSSLVRVGTWNEGDRFDSVETRLIATHFSQQYDNPVRGCLSEQIFAHLSSRKVAKVGFQMFFCPSAQSTAEILNQYWPKSDSFVGPKMFERHA